MGCFLSSSFVRFFFVSDNKRRAYYRSDPHLIRTCYVHSVINFE
jgi:hypothetical protein